ncbi:OB-fold-containig protein [Sphingobacterium litopenaei]|uniref:DUF1449 family protein n=1 Tax=Sphingobacterium litopenaei TaxID=2763500 RepID=A0ABR7YAE8_9SPHI|nr:OB-fold-containig protein [Sphingobacterium litopenaei]MBD1428282.1 DUF1449 family protein [Sphingobacterium litopenaei]
MTEVINILFHPLPNAIMTLLTGLSLVYWLFTMLLGDGFDFGDADVDVDFEGADIQDVESDTDLNAEGEAEPSFLSKAMDFINIGKAPFMVIVTLFKFIGWMITIASSLLFQLGNYGWKSVFILIPIFVLTYFLMHYVTIPVTKLYQKVGYTGEEAHEFLGRIGTMRSTIKGEKLGSAEIIIQNDVIRLNVKSVDGKEIQYGDEVLIVNETQDKKYYYVQKNINLNNF